jgi:ABC-type uncharacterized transport system auxiliary subunit
MKPNRWRAWANWGLVLMCILFVAGCFSRSKPPYLVDQYTLEYQPPAVAGLPLPSGSIKIERFSVAQTYNTRAMLLKQDAYRIVPRNYSRWRANPGDMVSDYLLRDLRAAAIFGPVFSYHDTEKARFIIEGGIEEFAEITEKEGQRAVLASTVTLLDSLEKELPGKVIFQKRYRVAEPLGGDTADAFARAMSGAASRFSGELLRDVYNALNQRQGQTK